MAKSGERYFSDWCQFPLNINCHSVSSTTGPVMNEECRQNILMFIRCIFSPAGCLQWGMCRTNHTAQLYSRHGFVVVKPGFGSTLIKTIPSPIMTPANLLDSGFSHLSLILIPDSNSSTPFNSDFSNLAQSNPSPISFPATTFN